MLADLRQRERVFELLFTEASPLPDDAEALRASSRRALARTALRVALADGYEAEPHSAQELVDFARELWPEVTTTRPWRQWQQHGDRQPAPATRAYRRVRSGLEWRRWRRYGL
jgi:hypothetical protein